MSLHEMRRSYTLRELNEKDIDSDPMVQFRTWIKEAVEGDLPDWLEINAMTLSTCDENASVSSRIVLLKGLDDGKFWFYTNYDSDKAKQMEANPNVSLCFLWHHMQRQIRIEGTVAKASREQSTSYFHKRPRDSQLGAMVSAQSSVVPSRQVLEENMKNLQEKYKDQDVPCPENWGGYAVTPRQIEFWQGRTSRLHDRLRYRLKDDKWIVQRLSP